MWSIIFCLTPRAQLSGVTTLAGVVQKTQSKTETEKT